MKVNIGLLTAQIAGMFAVFALALFLAAGTAAWPAGWAFLALFFSFTIALSLWLVRHSPGLLTERMTGFTKPDQKPWDRVFFASANILFLGWLVLMPLDAVRFGWSYVPLWLQLGGAALLLASFYGFFLIYGANPYLSPVVRLQTERDHTVVSGGPYRYVRHPMYANTIVMLVGTTLLLGSWWGLLPALALVAAMAWRAVAEERTLLAELPGYAAYMAQVRYRFVPGVW